MTSAPAPGARADGPALTLAADVQSRLGLRTETFATQRRAAQIDAFAKVLDPGPLAQLQSDLSSAEASAAASKAEAERARTLNAANGSVASKDAEAAEAQGRNDAERLAQLRRRLGLEWGPGIARMTDVQRQALIAQLARGEAALVHVDTPSNEGQAGARTVDIDVGASSVHGTVIGPARAAEPRLQSSGLIVKVAGKSAVLLSVGLTQSAHIATTDRVTGVVLPRAAVIRFQGSDWAYVKTGAATFERRLLPDPVAQDKGLFVAGGVKPGEPVIVQGAAEAFAVEQAQRTRSR
jgi:hypothetical protein